MSELDKSYELKVLKMVANKYLDETISATEASIEALEANCDQVVWELATRIYSQSGHKVELYILRDVFNSRIEVVKSQIATEKERVAEEARRIAEEKAAEEASLSDEITSIMEELKIEASQAKIFVKLRQIVSEQLEVEESEVTLDSDISNDLGADEFDTVELAAAIEEEFDIEIPNELLGSIYTKPPSYFSTPIDDSHIVAVACTVRELLIYIHKKVSL
ncbi:MAG: phosphopantetheine-binding protein [Coleofasciculaceae cyanobacterium]